jgi:hypothetical protein
MQDQPDSGNDREQRPGTPGTLGPLFQGTDEESAGTEVIHTSRSKVLKFTLFATALELIIVLLFLYEWNKGGSLLWPGVYLVVASLVLLYAIGLLGGGGPSLALGAHGLALLDSEGETIGSVPYGNIANLSVLEINLVRSQLLLTLVNKKDPDCFWPHSKRYLGDYCITGMFEVSLEGIASRISARVKKEKSTY